jgi:nitrate reductase gamma subunit
VFGIGFVCVILTYAAIILSISVIAFRTISIWRMPVHLRWELAPVPGEKGKDGYGGSYLEEYEWWTKKRKKSIVNELLYMAREIFLLVSVRENNKSLWIFSLPFHWGIYILAFTAALLGGDALFSVGIYTPAAILAYAGYSAGLAGTAGLLVKRAVDSNLRSYSAFSNYFNLCFLLVLFTSGLYALIAASGRFGYHVVVFISALIHADFNPAIPTALSVHIIVVMMFVVYLPFTQMIHFVAKYFTYHSIRWNDMPMNDKMGKAIAALMGQNVSWSGRHIQGGSEKNWIDIAQEDMNNEKDDKLK